METKPMKAMSWEEYFIKISHLVAKRSSCTRRQCGAVVVRDNLILSTGYNGTPRGVKNCNEGGCPRCNGNVPSGTKLEECLCVHAEENAIIQAAYNGVTVKGSTLYSSFCPCSYCAKSIINAGIKKVFYNMAYALDEISTKLFKEAGIELVRYEEKGD